MILSSPPKKFYRGKKRYAQYVLRSRQRRTIFPWAVTVKIGDYIGTCTGFNQRVVRIEYDWENEGIFRRCKKNRTWFLYEINFYNAEGGMHTAPGGGCVFPAQTNEEILEYYQSAWPKVSLPKLNEHGECIYTPEEDEAWRSQFALHYPEIWG